MPERVFGWVGSIEAADRSRSLSSGGDSQAEERTPDYRAQVDDAAAVLDGGDPRTESFARILQSSQRDGTPIFLILDSETRVVSELAVPFRTMVTSVDTSSVPGEARISLLFGNPCILRHEHARFDELLFVITDSVRRGEKIWLATSLDREVIDAVSEPSVPVPDIEPPPPFNETVPPVVSSVRACELFHLIDSKRSPAVGSALSDGIPFQFVPHGCEARAHEVCRLLEQNGGRAFKLWMFSFRPLLSFRTANHPNCLANWSYHVAPAIETDEGTRVIDPSLFDGPRPVTELRKAVGDAEQPVYRTCPDVYLMSVDRQVFMPDPSFTLTRQFIGGLNRGLELMSALHGPPPYQQCLGG